MRRIAASRLTSAGIGLQRHELAPQLLDDQLGGARMAQQDGDDVVAVETAGLAEEGLLAVVVLADRGLRNAPVSRSIDQPVKARAAFLMSASL